MLDNPSLNNAAKLAARVLLAALFIWQGSNKIPGYAGSAAYMTANGVPSVLLPLVILVEIGGGILLLVGYQARLAALALAGFCVLTALLFHLHPGNPGRMIMFGKDLALAGGLLQVFATGPGIWSVDGRRNA
jgi:putative oxidoreductase